ncbi:anti-sigma factor [Aporhodopirellula aestuarii]|uniref:Anti-sigma factor n=1 Tax=Aporhodopirellula aestuarii TaxID=2950107 RepID=A0ABT0UEW3_9BACT|nr:anti-sigma factor [Aporhodopirellula aestuarii]MCM2375246.1 anti-sigma factor [Aporhodopirellula aestuarii]
MNLSSSSPSEWEELLAGEALGDLDADELKRLESEFAGGRPESSAELMKAAAALDLALSVPDAEQMPDHLRQKIVFDASKHVPEHSANLANVELGSKSQRYATIPLRERLAWLAAAASILFAFGIWTLREPTIGPNQNNPIVAMDFGQAREHLKASEDHIAIEWAPGTTPFEQPVSGDVVWSNSKQEGFMRFVGMPVNDPNTEQYQLWIIDPARDDEPIDGGVFDVTDTGEVIVPIDAKLKVLEPAAFAITIEKPGGVVVSTQERLPLLAAVAN